MVLESTVVCVDNSEYMRNGDFLPSRLHAQQDAVKVVCHSKMRSHPENNIALMTMSSPEVLASLTTDVGRVLYRLTQIQLKGDVNFVATLRVAHLMLKHRENKSHKMRMVIFVGSPVVTTTGELGLLARRLKREKVNVDIVNFGEYAANMGKLSNFISILNGDGTGRSHMVTVPAGNILSKVVAGTPIAQGDSRSAINYDLDFDDDDPALVLALRVSMEEQRQWQDYEVRQEMANSPRDATLATSDTASALPELVPPVLPDMLPAEVDEDAMDTDEAKQVPEQDAVGDDEYDDIFQDPAFIMSILQSLPGVDTQSSVVQSALAEITHSNQIKEPADKDKDDKDKHKSSEGK
ncbi:26S proteasome non-ATPase regulatory subunit 4-like isoform X2 [Dermacentor albipictus]|uniref:26S proteasome non-ATPase regulatory subunit 4-like isoform X2 n=1 Tax=Dermacentor albipictus TaxID=60249 RepID=UPI0031FBE01D